MLSENNYGDREPFQRVLKTMNRFSYQNHYFSIAIILYHKTHAGQNVLTFFKLHCQPIKVKQQL